MKHSVQSLLRSLLLATAVLGFGLSLSGCSSTKQLHSTTQTLSISLEPQVLHTSGIAFITPSSVTGQEEDKQALALAFTEALKKARPELRVVPLPATLSAINLSRDTLLKVSRVAGVRYLAQLKLGGFRQESKNRWGTLGIRMLETKTTSLRLYLQIWDGENGSVAWEGAQELSSSHETLQEDAISFKTAVEQSAAELLASLP